VEDLTDIGFIKNLFINTFTALESNIFYCCCACFLLLALNQRVISNGHKTVCSTEAVYAYLGKKEPVF
jgi:hypothetical protein